MAGKGGVFLMARSLEIGILLHTRHLIREGGSSPSFEQLWENSVLAEEMGLDHIWIGDSITLLDKARGDCLTTMAALAMKTQKIKIGVVPFLPVLRQPVVLAHALATLDVISNGRLIIAASVASMREHIQRQFAACGVPINEKAGRLAESLQILRGLWTENTLTHEGRYYQLRDVGILPRPIQRPAIPIWLTADRHEDGFRRVAKLGDGWVTMVNTAEKFAEGRAKVDAYAREYGRAGKIPVAALYASFNLDENGDKARREGWAWMEKFFAVPKSQFAYHVAIFGTPEECARTIQGYVDAGMTTVIARIASADSKQQMRLLMNEVRPRLSL